MAVTWSFDYTPSPALPPLFWLARISGNVVRVSCGTAVRTGERGFFEAGEAAGDAFARENVGRGAAIADYDGDGDEDVVVNVNGGPARLLRNDGGSAQGWLRVVLRGDPRRRADDRAGHGGRAFATTTFANGAVVTVTAGGATRMQEIGAQRLPFSDTEVARAALARRGAR